MTYDNNNSVLNDLETFTFLQIDNNNCIRLIIISLKFAHLHFKAISTKMKKK